ncbi:hypothetical protein HWV62_24580 [Athelia sp. TMB]|nr:hypothetical protein HWV62_24580 [Athelia sp. TMB]
MFPATSLLVGLSLAGTFVAAQGNTSSEAGEAAITDPTTECTYYNYAPVTANIHNFPTIWQPATLLANDTAGQAEWAKISPSIPTNIPVKGTLTGNFSDFTPTYSPSDPDCWWTYDKCDTPKLASLKPDITSTPEPLSLGYGFDDGPNCSHNAFYDYLSSQNQKATMFYIGSNVMDWPLQAQRAIADGHEVCVHTWSHHYMTAFQSEDAFAELWYTLQAFKLVLGVTPKCWRPPYGDVDDRIRAIATGLNLTTIVWQYDSNDWQVGAPGATVTAAQVDANYQNLITSAGNGTFNTAGTIMLTHELTNYTMQEAIKWYPQLKAAFKSLVPVGVGMNWTQPYVETNYSLPAFSQYTAGQLTASATASGASASSSSSSTGGSSKSGASRLDVTAFGAVAAAVLVGVLSA